MFLKNEINRSQQDFKRERKRRIKVLKSEMKTEHQKRSYRHYKWNRKGVREKNLQIKKCITAEEILMKNTT